MLTLNQCREKLKNNGIEYTDEQVLSIRDYLYNFAKINVDYINKKLKDNEQKSDYIHKSIN